MAAGDSAGRRPVWAEVDLDAIRSNAATLGGLAAPAALCAVVKANAYGHGSTRAAQAALDGGATSLGVALVEEGSSLRHDGIVAPILLLSEPPHEAMADVHALGLIPTVYTSAGVVAAAKAVADGPDQAPMTVHVKVDTGMHRVGASPADVVDIAMAVRERPELRLGGLWTHFAVADRPDDPFTSVQASRFDEVVTELGRRGMRPPTLHASNSAGCLAHPSARYDMVRCGIALYGVAPSPALVGRADLHAVLSLRARVSHVRWLAAGEGVSYGLHYRLPRRSLVATVPVGYADGVPWRLGGAGGHVLIGGRRRPIAGSVTMDQITVDCGDDGGVSPGDEVVLLGRQGDECVDAWEWARLVDTIAYEVVCRIGPRVPRTYIST